MSLDSAAKVWEEANATFESTLIKYLDACQALESSALVHPPGLNTQKIISLLGSRLDAFQTQLTQQLVDARLCLARTRNKLSRTMYRLPDEILATIFQLVIDGTDSGPYYHIFSDYRIRARYIHLNRLLGVCTVWRRVRISHGALWTLVPLATKRPRELIGLTLSRSRGSRLQLAGMVDSTTPLIWEYSGLAKNGHRFGAVNLYPGGEQPDPGCIRETLSALLKSSHPGSLTDLSFCSWEYSRSPPRISEYLFPQNSPRNALLGQFADSLNSLRINGFNLHSSGMTLTKLVELRLQEVVLRNTDLVNFLVATASAPSLRSVQMISITTCDDQTGTSQPDQPVPGLPVLLSSLQLLYLEDLYQDALELVLRSIIPGSYRVVLQYRSIRCFHTNTPDGEVYLGTESLRLQGLKIDSLMLAEDSADEDELRPLLQAMPTLKELCMDEWHITREGLKAMTRFPEDSTADGIHNFPKLHTLYLTCCDIDDIENLGEFQEMVASHGIQELGLSVAFKVPLAPGGCEDRSDISMRSASDNQGSSDGLQPSGNSQDLSGSENLNDSDDSITDGYSREGCPLTDPRASSLKNWLDMTVPKVNYSTLAENLPEPNFGTCEWRMW